MDPSRFHDLAASIEGVEIRQMFGAPAGFVGGNLAFSLHPQTLIVRLPEDECQARLEDGWQRFEPMAGRPMRQYFVLPRDVADDAGEVRLWMERAATYARTLPPKAPKSKRR